jgi:hypothetical protein
MLRIAAAFALALSLVPGLAQAGGQNQAPGVMAPGPGAAPQFSPPVNLPAPDLPPIPPDPSRFSPQVQAWASLRAAGLARFGEIPDAEEMPGYLRQAGFGLLGDMSEADIMALAFLVLMQAAKGAEEDLKAIMDKVKGYNSAKSKSREVLSARQKSSGAEEGGLDDLQKLQNLTERRSKLLATLSNLLKKRSDSEREVAASQK